MTVARVQIEKVVRDMENCSDDVKIMLVQGLPHAFGNDRHEFQVRFAGMLKLSLEQAKKYNEEMQKKSDDQKQETDKALEVAQSELEARKAEESAADAAKEGRIAAHKEAQALSKQELEMHNESCTKKGYCADARNVLENERAEIASVLDDSLHMLANGEWNDPDFRDTSINAICDYLKSIGTDPALRASFPKALSNKPAERGCFDKMAVDEAVRVLDEKAQAVAQKLAAGQVEFDEVNAEALGAWAIWEEAKDRESSAATEVTTAMTAAKKAANETKMAQSKVRNLEKERSELLAQRALLESKAEQIDLAFVSFETLEKGEEAVVPKKEEKEEKEEKKPVFPDVDMGLCAAAMADVEMKEVGSVAMVC